MRYSRIIAAVKDTAWFIREEKLNQIVAFLEFKANGGQLSEEEIAAIRQPKREPYLIALPDGVEGSQMGQNGAEASAPQSASRSRAGAIAVLPIFGTLTHRADFFSDFSGGTTTSAITGWLRSAMADDRVRSIVMEIDSPGGSVQGIQELADEIVKAKASKPIVAMANTMAASAAYYLASQATELVVTPSGEVGSIGVFMAHQDVSGYMEQHGVKTTFIKAGKYKTEANEYEPLSSDAKDALQEKVNAYYEQFVSAVARGRNTTAAKVKAGFGEGRMVMAKEAVALGMADRVATFDQQLKRMGATDKTPMPMNEKRLVAEAGDPEPEADAVPAHIEENRRREREMDMWGLR